MNKQNLPFKSFINPTIWMFIIHKKFSECFQKYNQSRINKWPKSLNSISTLSKSRQFLHQNQPGGSPLKSPWMSTFFITFRGLNQVRVTVTFQRSLFRKSADPEDEFLWGNLYENIELTTSLFLSLSLSLSLYIFYLSDTNMVPWYITNWKFMFA